MQLLDSLGYRMYPTNRLACYSPLSRCSRVVAFVAELHSHEHLRSSKHPNVGMPFARDLNCRTVDVEHCDSHGMSMQQWGEEEHLTGSPQQILRKAHRRLLYPCALLFKLTTEMLFSILVELFGRQLVARLATIAGRVDSRDLTVNWQGSRRCGKSRKEKS